MSNKVIITNPDVKNLFIKVAKEIAYLIEDGKKIENGLRRFTKAGHSAARRYMKKFEHPTMITYGMKSDLDEMILAEISQYEKLRNKILKIIALIENGQPVNVNRRFGLSIRSVYIKAKNLRKFENEIMVGIEDTMKYFGKIFEDALKVSSESLVKHILKRKEILDDLISNLKRIYLFEDKK